MVIGLGIGLGLGLGLGIAVSNHGVLVPRGRELEQLIAADLVRVRGRGRGRGRGRVGVRGRVSRLLVARGADDLPGQIETTAAAHLERVLEAARVDIVVLDVVRGL